MGSHVHQITIEEVDPKPHRDKEDREAWSVQLRIDNQKVAGGLRTIRDPFTSREHSACSKCLNEGLMDGEYDPPEAEDISNRIDRYRDNLIECLRMTDIACQARFNGSRILIDIKEPSKRLPTQRRTTSIHSLHWELLERQDATWFANAASLIVRRTIADTHQSPSLSRVQSDATNSGLGSVFPVLLVVARHFRDEEDLSPSIIQCTLLRIQERLVLQGRFHKIHLEVVRPGSLEELKTHLEKRSTSNRQSFFKVVHFDLHGGLSMNTAYLAFNSYNEVGDLITTQVPASEIAAELKNHHIPCAVLSACESAVANVGVDANLSRVFIQNGVSTVLAMSFRASETMVTIFYEEFYSKFFLDTKEFSEAASEARKRLERNRLRLNKYGEELQLQDWFVPVTYTNGKSLCAVSHHPVPEDLEHISRVSTFQLLESTLLSAMAAVASYPVVIIAMICCIMAPEVLAKYWRKMRHERQYLNLDPKKLDNNVLRVEGALRLPQRQVYFHSAQGIDDTVLPFLDSLSHLWLRTHFVNRLIVIRAESLIETSWLRRKWHEVYWRVLKGYPHHDLDEPFVEEEGNEDETIHDSGSREPSTVIIIQNVHKLYPEPREKSGKYDAAQDKMRRWLEERFRSHVSPLARPYLVLVGKGEKDWLEKHMRNYDFLDAKATEYSLTLRPSE